jgi:hypothetical protein
MGRELSAMELVWVKDPVRPLHLSVHCRGLHDAAVLQKLSAPGWTLRDWQALMPVRAEQAGRGEGIDLPPMAGDYAVRDGEIIFTPLFPAQPGVKYWAVFRPRALPGGGSAEPALTASHLVEKAEPRPATAIAQVLPDSDPLPENTLKFYLHFSAPMSGGGVYQHVRLLDAVGRAVKTPFLEIEQEMWNHEMTRLTLFIDPGRIKRGLAPRADLGPVLQEGQPCTLEIDGAWLDANGQPLTSGFRRTFQVGPPDHKSPAPARWVITAPAEGDRGRLRVRFDEPLDQALAVRLLQVVGMDARIAGESAVMDHGREWQFVPSEPWKAGEHHVETSDILEDLAGNSVGKPFEVDQFTGIDPPSAIKTVRLPFVIR